MTKLRISLFLMIIMSLAPWVAQAQQTYQNPVISASLPDPSIIKAQDGCYYLYATEDDHNVPVYRSYNLVDWTKVGTAFTDETRPDFLTDGSIWAPDINYINGKYVLYFSLSKWGEGTNNGIGVAVGDRPVSDRAAGRFGKGQKLFTSAEIGVENSIDPFFFSDNGHNYLYWGSFNGIYCIELSDDGLSIKEGATKVKVINKTVEAASIIKHDGYYYFIGSEGSCCDGANSTYKLVMARSTSPTSGFKNKNGQDVQSDGTFGVGLYNLSNLLTGDGTNVIGPGHCSEIVQDNDGKYWMVHHGFSASDVDGGRRVFLEEVKWGNDGWPYIEGGHPAVTASAPALLDAYEIATAQDLVDYANIVNNGGGHVYAKLTADIDMTGITDFPGIGNDSHEFNRFHATLDGQGHRIKNLNMNGNDVALINVASDNAVIKNLIIDSSCSFTGGGRNAAFVSAANWPEWGSYKIEFYNCGNEAEVVGTSNNCAAFLGCNYNGNLAVVISNCYNAGHIKGGGESAALSGWIGNNGNSRIDHCYNIAEVEGIDGDNNNLFRGTAGGQWYISNCYDTHYDHNCPKLDPSVVASGELCYTLNQGVAEPQWHQKLDVDAHPLPVGEGNFVYRNGDFYCYGVSKGTESFGNTDASNYDAHQFGTDDLCDVCFQHDVMSGREPAQVSDVYQIGTIGNLVWFGNAVNGGQVTLNGALTADIEQGRAIYTPIGNASNVYKGHFDGQTHSITLQLDNGGYDYQGIFGIITDGVRISNLIARGSIKGHSFVGGIAGGTNGGSSNAWQVYTVLENCGNEATVTATGVNAGGMIGVNMNGSASFIFTNCYNMGAINGNESGALSGWSGGGWSVFHNCYNAAKVNNGGDADFSRNNGTQYYNCYYVEGCNNTSRDGVDDANNVLLQSVTATQLANGELRDKLNLGQNANWFQYSGEAYPLPFDHDHPTIVPGDVNGDNVADFRDVPLLARILTGVDPEIPAADVNGDGFVTLADLTLLVNIVNE